MLPTCGNDIPYPVAFPPKPFTLVDALGNPASQAIVNAYISVPWPPGGRSGCGLARFSHTAIPGSPASPARRGAGAGFDARDDIVVKSIA